MPELIRLAHIHRRFVVGEQIVHALDDVSLSIEAGEYISVMGPSGSGKSTLLNLLGLLDRADEGQYFFDGKETTALSEVELARIRREEIGFVFQFFHLIPRLTAAENIELPMILAGLSRRVRQQRVAEALAAVGLAERGRHRPDQLSGGQRQRVAIARATIMQPKLLLADEPTGNLDQHSGKEIIELLEQLGQQGLTLIVVTHDPQLGHRARRRLQLVDGAIVADDAS